MSLTAALLVAAAACSWDAPGNNRYSGSVTAAVDNYKDIPNIVRNKLKQRIDAKQYDDVASINKWGIQGKYSYSNLRDMHFGTNKICASVSTDKWNNTQQELGLVFCEEEHCIIIPTVCGNVSRITRHITPNNISFLKQSTYTEEATDVNIPPVAFSLAETISSEEEPKDEYIGTGLYRSGAWTIIPVTPAFSYAPIAPIPEPSTWALTMLGLAAIAAFKTRLNGVLHGPTRSAKQPVAPPFEPPVRLAPKRGKR